MALLGFCVVLFVCEREQNNIIFVWKRRMMGLFCLRRIHWNEHIYDMGRQRKGEREMGRGRERVEKYRETRMV